MSEFTYEINDRKHRYETYEWDNTWIDHPNDYGVKRVLYIGDSISCGIRKFATTAAGGKIVFDLFGTSKAIDNPFFKDALTVFTNQEERRDMIIINNGLHGFHLDDEKEYKEFYEDMIKFLLNEFDETPLVVVLTTYVASDADRERVLVRNKSALEVAEKYELPVIDLFSASENVKTFLKEDGIHFTDEGLCALADKVVETVVNVVQ